jgi:hypothetical protein
LESLSEGDANEIDEILGNSSASFKRRAVDALECQYFNPITRLSTEIQIEVKNQLPVT